VCSNRFRARADLEIFAVCLGKQFKHISTEIGALNRKKLIQHDSVLESQSQNLRLEIFRCIAPPSDGDRLTGPRFFELPERSAKLQDSDQFLSAFDLRD
jgi:hypothetical protein